MVILGYTMFAVTINFIYNSISAGVGFTIQQNQKPKKNTYGNYRIADLQNRFCKSANQRKFTNARGEYFCLVVCKSNPTEGFKKLFTVQGRKRVGGGGKWSILL